MLNSLLVLLSKGLSKVSKTFNLGNGSTWPGHIALGINPHIIENTLKDSLTQVILIIGTNGKTTTAKILTTILQENRKNVIQNTSGANLLNGIASSLLINTNISNKLKADYAVFEVDENNLPIVLQHITPKIIIALDLFRDQLDRYGELDSIAKKWNTAFQNLTEQATLILNSDDPLIAYAAKDVKAKVVYFGLSKKEKGQKHLEHAADSIYCPNCGNKLMYTKIFYSHLGVWHCPHCGVKRPLPNLSETFYPLQGTYNKYNTLAAVLAAKTLNIPETVIQEALQKVVPAFGRQEKLIYKGKSVQIFLSKNPVSMNESLETVVEFGAKHVLFALNDRIPDGRDISWIWDIAMEEYISKFKKIFISGDRCFDMGLRISYSMQFPISNFQFPNNDKNSNIQIYENLQEAIDIATESINDNGMLYILPTYSAMLEVRKILTGKKIL